MSIGTDGEKTIRGAATALETAEILGDEAFLAQACCVHKMGQLVDGQPQHTRDEAMRSLLRI